MFDKSVLSFSLIAAVAFLQSLPAIAQATRVSKWLVEKNSSLRVKGRTNINSFTCNINELARRDTIFCLDNGLKPLNFTGEIKMDVLNFDCNSGMITKGLRNTLKADVYPTMFIRFLSIQLMPVIYKENEVIKGWVEVELAGVTKKFELFYRFEKSGTSQLQLTGYRGFCFSDFNLTPPKKFGGLIRIKDEFDVDFKLLLRGI